MDAGDPERAGKPSLWVTNYENELHALYRNAVHAGPAVLPVPDRRPPGSRPSARSTSAGGPRSCDVDLDGWEDLFVANGHAIRYPTGKDGSRKQRPVLLLNQGGGKFRTASERLGTYFQAPHLGRGVAFGDLDNDGRVDLVVSHLNEPVAVLAERRPAGDAHWLGVELVGQGTGDVVGARVDARGRRPEADPVRQGRRELRLVARPPAPVRPGRNGAGSTGDGHLAGRQRGPLNGLKSDRYYALEQGKPESRVGR